jgi:PAS domain S-box-containing protein
MTRQDSNGASTKPSPTGKVPPLLRAGLDALSFGFAVFDKDLKLVASNRAFRELRGYPNPLCKPGTEIGELYRFNAERGDYGPGDIEAHVKSRLNRARQFRPYELEYELATGRILSIRYTPIADGGFLITYADVTERKRAELALRESEERYALAMAGANEGMWDWSAGNDEIVISDSYKRLVGLEQASDRISLDQWVALIHPDDLAARDEAKRAHNDGITNIYECEYRVRCGDGQYRWFLDRARSIRDEHGNIYRMAGSMTDVTARKRAEQELVEANRRINEQNRMLEKLSAQLSKYLSPQVYSSIFSGKQSVEIASKRRKLTVFFSDIAGFTETTDLLESEELTSLLNQYLTEMSKIALEYGATIDKFVGDAIIVFFGDPETKGVQEDAIACVRMAIAMQRRMGDLQAEWRDRGVEHPFQLRIGINTGYCTVGNFGSEDRMEYTIVGNEVNLAARLQSHAEPGGILMTYETCSLIKDRVLTEEGDTVTVKGFARPVRTYKVVGLYDDLAHQGRIIHLDQDGLTLTIDRNKLTTDGLKALAEVVSQVSR